MPYQISLIFNQRKQGWTETWYVKDPESLSDAIAAGEFLAIERRKLCGGNTNIEAIRASDEEVIGDSRLRNLPWNDEPSDIADQAGAAILVRVEAGGLYRRSMWLRGCPDIWITTGGGAAPNVGAGAITPVKKFIAALMSADIHACLKVGAKTGVGGTGLPVTGTDLSNDGGWTKVTVGGLGAAIGEKILMKKWKGFDRKLLNRSYEVIDTSPTFVTINLSWTSLTAPELNYRGRIYSRNIQYSYVSSGTIVRAAIRKTGRAFFVPRGRRSPPSTP